MPRDTSTTASGAIPDGQARDALQACLDVLLRMIPDYCTDRGAEPCTDAEHDLAIEKAAYCIYGTRPRWPAAVQKAADGGYP
jgi:hypothetical protein